MYKLITIILISTLCLINIRGQKKFDDLPPFISEKSGCELTEAELHAVFTKFKQNALEKSFLVIIGRTAKSEKQIYNSKRISTVVDYFLTQGVDKPRIIFAKGQAVDNFGYIEIYVNGQLWLIMQSNPKGNFCTYCCEAPDVKIQP